MMDWDRMIMNAQRMSCNTHAIQPIASKIACRNIMLLCNRCWIYSYIVTTLVDFASKYIDDDAENKWYIIQQVSFDIESFTEA